MTEADRIPQSGETGFDLDSRHAQVVGAGPRIAALADEEMDPQARALVQRTRAAVGARPLAVVPEYTRLLAKHPEIFRCNLELGTALFRGQLQPRERELTILRVAWLCRAPYEWGEHVAIAKRWGVLEDEIERVTRGSSDPGWTDHQAAILRGAEELIADHSLSDETYVNLARSWSESQLIEYLVVVGQYVATAFLQNSLRVRLTEGNQGLSRR